MISEDVIRKGRLGTLIMYGAAFAGLVAETPSATQLPAAVVTVGTLTASGFAFALISYVRARARQHRWETIHGYFRDVQAVLAHAAFAMLCLFCLTFLLPALSGRGPEVPGWYLPGIVAIAVHQFVRGARRLAARWRTIDDVAQGLAGAAATTQRFSAKYDIGFFIGVSIVTSIVSQFVGSDPMLLIGGGLAALSFPYALGSIIYQRVVLARLLPKDMSLADWHNLVRSRSSA